MSCRALLLVMLTAVGQASAQSPAAVPYPQDYKTKLVKYAVVDRADGMSRDLYASPEAVEALRRDPRLKEFPVGVLFALDVHSARAVGRDPKTRAPRFEVTPQGHLVRSKDERTLQPDGESPAGIRQSELGVRRVRSGHRRAVEAPAPRRLPAVPSGGDDERHDVLHESAEWLHRERYSAV
jgi:hypothetical protein